MAGSAPTEGRIFISYRREETAYPAAWLFDRLSDTFGTEQIFKDVDSMEPGDDFVAVITSAVESCDVLLALIGTRWLTVTDHAGNRRLDNPDDFVRLEIEAALTRGVRVIPILVEGARMPRADELPPSLAKLVRRHALELSPSGFNFETSRLLKVLNKALAGRTGAPTPAVVEADPPPSADGPEATTVATGTGASRPEPAGPSDEHGAEAPPQWAVDPFGAHDLRYWDGARWTEHVSDDGVLGTDPPVPGKREPRLQPLRSPGEAPRPFPAGGAAIYFPEGTAVSGVVVMPDRYATVQDLLDDVYGRFLHGHFPRSSYGRVWLVCGTSRCIVPLTWVFDVGRPVGDTDEGWSRLSPADAGLRGNQAYRVFSPADHRYCGVVVDDLRVLRSLEARADAFFEPRRGQARVVSQLLQHQAAPGRSLYVPVEVADMSSPQHGGVFMCGSLLGTAGRVVDLRGPGVLQAIQGGRAAT